MRELAERAVACKHWRWMAGMRALDSTGEEHPARVIDHRRSVVYEDNDGAIHEGVLSRSDVPDLTDPATLGCLRHLAAKAHGAWDIVIQVDIAPRMEGTHGWWRAIDSRGRKIQGAFGTFVCPNDGTDIKVHALVAALEAAP